MSVHCQKCPLRRRPAFKQLTEDELSFMDSFKMGELHVDAGAPVILEGSNSPHFYTVLRGAGMRDKGLADGRRQVVNFIFPGDLVGLQSGLLGEMKHGVEAVSDMALCVFSRERLWELFRQHPERAYDVTWLAATEERSLGEALLSVGRRAAKERIAQLLIYMLRRAVESGFTKDEARMRFPFRQQDLADAAGLSSVHTNKTLQALRRQGMIRLDAGELEILKPAALGELAEYSEPVDPPGRPLL
ncbi:Crp/Fnr family transcriptional regulator [Pikeienuella piscinae]|uniref:Crp/Fnr family transcriptional regulator n=1 Tax=Pikeienuella piscinae TaxID=2748098 RepID=A0A7L5C1G0_9RHOB|nr:Crp/Fnr family transcriptional regulator [Pikeienuella piscinae]QIE55689.1 Crp/Fnr family transcriptional regulator [Pikeienuella piscinae]